MPFHPIYNSIYLTVDSISNPTRFRVEMLDVIFEPYDGDGCPELMPGYERIHDACTADADRVALDEKYWSVEDKPFAHGRKVKITFLGDKLTTDLESDPTPDGPASVLKTALATRREIALSVKMGEHLTDKKDRLPYFASIVIQPELRT